MAEHIPPSHHAYASAQSSLEVVLRNPSWNMHQRQVFVERMCRALT